MEKSKTLDFVFDRQDLLRDFLKYNAEGGSSPLYHEKQTYKCGAQLLQLKS